MANHNIATYTHTNVYNTDALIHSNERDEQFIIHRPDSTSSGHSLFLTVSLNFKSILHFEKLINDLTKSHTNLH